ncbi:unnamed protein product [Urochloa humidicola]
MVDGAQHRIRALKPAQVRGGAPARCSTRDSWLAHRRGVLRATHGSPTGAQPRPRPPAQEPRLSRDPPLLQGIRRRTSRGRRRRVGSGRARLLRAAWLPCPLHVCCACPALASSSRSHSLTPQIHGGGAEQNGKHGAGVCGEGSMWSL